MSIEKKPSSNESGYISSFFGSFDVCKQNGVIVVLFFIPVGTEVGQVIYGFKYNFNLDWDVLHQQNFQNVTFFIFFLK